MAYVIVSNKSSQPKGEIIAVFEDDHEFTHNERMSTWIQKGNSAESWPRTFSLIHIKDRSKSELEYLTGVDSNEKGLWFFVEPPAQSPRYIELLNDGEVSVNFDECLPYLKGRG